MNPARARPEFTGEATISVSTCRSKTSPLKEPGAGLITLTLGPGLCAHPRALKAANATARNNNTRDGAIFKTDLRPSTGVAHSSAGTHSVKHLCDWARRTALTRSELAACYELSSRNESKVFDGFKQACYESRYKRKRLPQSSWSKSSSGTVLQASDWNRSSKKKASFPGKLRRPLPATRRILAKDAFRIGDSMPRTA